MLGAVAVRQVQEEEEVHQPDLQQMGMMVQQLHQVKQVQAEQHLRVVEPEVQAEQKIIPVMTALHPVVQEAVPVIPEVTVATVATVKL